MKDLVFKMGLRLLQEDNHFKRLGMFCAVGEDPKRGAPGRVQWEVSTALAEASHPLSLPCSPRAPRTHWAALREGVSASRSTEQRGMGGGGENGREGRG